MLSKAIKDLSRGLSLYHVWLYQAYHEVSAKYKRTALGSLWISGAMVATSVALSFVMGGLQHQDLHVVLPFIMGGIVAYALCGYILLEAPEAYMSSSGIIRNHAYPFTYYMFESVTRVFIVFLHNVVVLYIVLAILGKLTVPHWSLLFGLVVNYINSLLWGSLIAMIAARYRDMRFLLPFSSQIVFFMTPVFWHAETLSGWRVHIVNFNPFYGLMEIVRSPLLGTSAPALAWMLALCSLGGGATLWLIFFSLFRRRIAFWV